jgi:glutamyl-tRNA synthetase
MSLGGPVFDLEKLKWLNEKYIHELSYEDLADAIISWRLNKEYLVKLLPLMRERIKKLDELIPGTEFFFSGDLEYGPLLAEMVVPEVAPIDVSKGLLDYVERFEARASFTKGILEEVARQWAEALNWKPKHAFMLLRLATTGRKATPPLFDTMAVLGKEITRRRLRRAAELIKSGGK